MHLWAVFMLTKEETRAALESIADTVYRLGEQSTPSLYGAFAKIVLMSEYERKDILISQQCIALWNDICQNKRY